MMVGDSNGAGAGDWLYSINHNSNSPFNSAHVLHQITGQDILNIATSGYGSIQANVFEPVKKFETINASPFISLAPPDEILIYFYEGNDIENNVRDFFRHNHKDIPREKRALRQTLEKHVFPQQLVAARKKLNRFMAPLENTFHVFRSFLRIMRHEIKLLLGTTSEPYVNISNANKTGSDHAWIKRKDKNIFNVANTWAGAPSLQGAGPELKDIEINDGALIFESSLHFLKSYFPTARLKVVYIPSPASIYKFINKKLAITVQVPGRPVKLYSYQKLLRRSDQICNAVQLAAKQVKADFIDLRAHLRMAAIKEIIHGPVDAGHFNQRGYEELAKGIIASGKNKSCKNIAMKS